MLDNTLGCRGVICTPLYPSGALDYTLTSGYSNYFIAVERPNKDQPVKCCPPHRYVSNGLGDHEVSLLEGPLMVASM